MDENKAAQQVIDWLDQNQAPFIHMADQSWSTPELGLKEFKSSKV